MIFNSGAGTGAEAGSGGGPASSPGFAGFQLSQPRETMR